MAPRGGQFQGTDRLRRHRPDLFKRLKPMRDVDAFIAECDKIITRHDLDRE